MSRKTYQPTGDRTAQMIELVRGMYPTGENRMSLSHVVIEEVAPGTGWSGSTRWADLVALCVWPSRGITLDGYELKASREDLKRELADPDKHRSVARYCNHWWLVAWDESVLVDDIPEDWGVMVTRDSANGRELHTVRRAPQRTPEPWSQRFICSLVRNAYEQSPGLDYVARVVASARERGLRDGASNGRGELHRLLDSVREVIYGTDRWKWPEHDDVGRFVTAVLDRLAQGVLGGGQP